MSLQAELNALAESCKDVAEIEATFWPDGSLCDNQSGYIELFFLYVRGSAPAGTGTKILTQLFAIADRAGLPISLYALPCYGKGLRKAMTDDELIGWYRRRGFEKTSVKRRLVRPPTP
mgnify:CR=1 FL=1